MSDRLESSANIFRDLAERMVKQVQEPESQLATAIVHWLDAIQDSADMAGVKADTSAANAKYKDWDDFTVYIALRQRLWSEFGEGQDCYLALMNKCKSRGYSQMYAFCGFKWMVSATKVLDDE